MRTRVLLGIVGILSIATADTLTLRSGKTVQGQYLGGTARQVRMAVGDDIQTFDVTDVASLQFEAGQPSAAVAPAQPSVSQSAAVQTTVPSPAPAPAVSTQAEPAKSSTERILHVEPRGEARPAATVNTAGVMEIPAGTAVTIRMIDSVDSREARPGQTFKASVDDPVMVGDRVVVPRGADVTTKLVEVKDPSKLTGGGQLTLDLASISVNGRVLEVASQSVTTTGESRTGDTAKVIGGTAALGAIIGAIAGGGRGAAIGAASGAGAGTAVRVLTSGPEVRIPSETRLTFSLQSPVKL